MTESEYFSRLVFDPNAMKAVRLKTNKNGGDAKDREEAILFVTSFLTLVNKKYPQGQLNVPNAGVISDTATEENTYFVLPGFESLILNQPVIVFFKELQMWVLRVQDNLSMNINIKTIQSHDGYKK